MSEDLELEPLGKAIEATLPDGKTFVLIVMDRLSPAEVDAGKGAHTQLLSPLAPPYVLRALRAFVKSAQDDPLFRK